MKKIGLGLLFVGFLAGSFAATYEVASVPWGFFIPAAAAMLVGLVLVRLAAREEKSNTEEQGDGIQVLDRCLDSLVTKLAKMNGAKDDIFVYDVHGMIDADLMADLNDFVEARESLIPVYGLQRYADLMTQFANSERLINRSWSASADGYIDEVWKSLGQAETLMRNAQALLVEYQQGKAA